MGKNKHNFTPGPWYVGDDAAPDCPDHHNSGLALVDTGRSGDWPIARLCEWNNVNLIAAAPELLAALEAVLNSDMAQREEDEGRVSETLDKVRAAISLATQGGDEKK
jgi:hypothetical protein